MSEHLDEQEQAVPRCQRVSPTPWGPSQCALPDGHDEQHLYDPSEGKVSDCACGTGSIGTPGHVAWPFACEALGVGEVRG